MTADRCDDGDLPAQELSRAEAPVAAGGRASLRAVDREERNLDTYYADLCSAVDGDYVRNDHAAEVSGSDGDYSLSADASADRVIEQGCERIREIEERILSPRMRRTEASDSERDLAGFEHRLKGAARLEEKVARDILDKGSTAQRALAAIPDAVRYTFRYGDDQYAAGVRADIRRLQGCGFELVKLRNTWGSDQYRGINSQWREPQTGQRFEVQFHTGASYDTKQLTHRTYEQLRSPDTTDEQARELRHAQRRICRQLPVPPGAKDIPDFP